MSLDAGMSSMRATASAAAAGRSCARIACARSTRIVDWNQRSPISTAIRSASSSARSAAAASPASISASASNTAIQTEACWSPSSARPPRALASSLRASSKRPAIASSTALNPRTLKRGEAPGDLALERAQRRLASETGTALTTSAHAM